MAGGGGYGDSTHAIRESHKKRTEREAEAKKNAPSGFRDVAAAAEASELAGEPVDGERVARAALYGVIARGEDKDVVNAARAFLPPRKARDDLPEDHGLDGDAAPVAAPLARLRAALAAGDLEAAKRYEAEASDVADPFRSAKG
jgi:hypothetical protein